MTLDARRIVTVIVTLAVMGRQGAAQERTTSYVRDDGPEVLSVAAPEYPPIAASACIQGSVPVIVELDAAGKVVGTDVVHGHPLLRAAAEQAATHWTFRAAPESARRRQAIKISFALFPWRATEQEVQVVRKSDTEIEVRSRLGYVGTGDGRINEALTDDHEKKCLGRQR